jgi:C4-dicarboxylate-specific signal transduction histidine kinase
MALQEFTRAALGRGRSDPSSAREYAVSRLSGRYVVALGLVALLVLLNQILVQPRLLELATDAPVINIAGRQRMLSQRLAKAALALTTAHDEARRRRDRAELEWVLQLWTASHHGLRQGNRALSLPGRNSVAVRAAFNDLEPYFTRMRDAATRLVRKAADRQPEKPSVDDELATILAFEGPYLGRMDRIVSLFERETQARVDRLLWTGWVVTALILITLVAIGRFVLRPAVQLIRRQILELREGRDALEDRVQERTGELERANRELAREVRERTLAESRHRALVEQFSHVARTTTIGEMASGLAHELNQPLGAIANYAEGCLVALDSPSPALDEVRAALERLLAATLRAGQIIKRIRRFVTRHELEKEPFEPNRVVEEVEELYRDEAQRRGITLGVQLAPELPNLYGDPVQVQQVLVNLVGNAFEALAASESHEPTVLMQTWRASAGAVEFRVTDNGEGIPQETLGNIFDAYFSTRAGGMGMGLAISRTIVEAHHGRFAVESEPGVGTTFRFTLPVAGADDAGPNGLHRGR